MVYLALSHRGANEIFELARRTEASVWIGVDAVTDAEYNRLGEAGLKISRFVYPLSNAAPEVIEASILTVIQHHPGEIVWVERRNVP